MPKRRKLSNLETYNLKLETQGKRKEKEIDSGSRLPTGDPPKGNNDGNKKFHDEKKTRSKRNYQKDRPHSAESNSATRDRLEILIVNGKMTIQDYSEEHDSEKLIEMLKAIGIKSRVKSDGPCG